MTKTELMNTVTKMFENAGYKNQGCPNVPTYYTDAKFSVKTYETSSLFGDSMITMKDNRGITISASVVNKHNAAEDDISVDVYVSLWEGTTSRVLHKVRVNTKQSIKTTAKKVESIMSFYETFENVA